MRRKKNGGKGKGQVGISVVSCLMGFFVFLLFSSAVTVVVMIFDRQLIEL